ncbi:MAG: L-seryl-tRNA(Sec) selenium transferase [Armatimonadetes bacterium]|nr:L-seryl-tRNA(Sec) selenium transferase [Armatimonadota bacterium]
MRQLPSVDRLLSHPEIERLLSRLPRPLVVDAVRRVIEDTREAIKAGGRPEISLDALVERAAREAVRKSQPSLRRAVNATGVILHTGLGRAVLAPEAREAIAAVSSGHSTLEIDVETGRRGSRVRHVEGILCRLTGAEAATVVNNNAAAVLLAVNTLAEGGEVIISRGQLVEIGGQFRIPDIIRQAGCRLVEVGTTNRTRISDYAHAVTDDTALILMVHPSNFRIVGFSETASVSELVEIGKDRGIPVMHDLGSGALVDLSAFGLKDEPLVQESARAGCDIVTFSGDKLLGATQGGIILGRADLIEQCRRNPLARVVRVDKLTLAGLEATLRLFLDPERAMKSIPTLRYITRPLPEVAQQARKLASALRRALGDSYQIEVIDVESQVGGGSLPGQAIASKAVTLRSSRLSAEDLSNHFRRCETPVFGRIESDRFVLDMRTVEPAEIQTITTRAQMLANME